MTFTRLAATFRSIFLDWNRYAALQSTVPFTRTMDQDAR